MFQVFATALMSALLIYCWLSSLGAPIVHGITRASRARPGARGELLAMAAGVVAVTLLVPAAALILLLSIAPSTAATALVDPALPAGIQIGVVVWGGRVLSVGLPRSPLPFEEAVTVAALALRAATPAEVVERHYESPGARVVARV